jgi:HTH-type transcriptional repressor of NAD biosynthesis genes
LLGAQSTGKTQLSLALARTLNERGQEVHVAPEMWRAWCDAHGHTPELHDQSHRAQRQTDAVLSHLSGTVIADTTPLLSAVYHHQLFQDESLYDLAITHQRLFDMTLVTGLDLPWIADSQHCVDPCVRESVDTLLRHALQRAGIGYKVIYGQGQERLNNALLALGWDTAASHPTMAAAQATRVEGQYALNRGRTAWTCDTCSDADCEHRLFTDLIQSPP